MSSAVNGNNKVYTYTQDGDEYHIICTEFKTVLEHVGVDPKLGHTGGTAENLGNCTRCGTDYISYGTLSKNGFLGNTSIDKTKIESVTFVVLRTTKRLHEIQTLDAAAKVRNIRDAAKADDDDRHQPR